MYPYKVGDYVMRVAGYDEGRVAKVTSMDNRLSELLRVGDNELWSVYNVRLATKLEIELAGVEVD